MNEPHKVETETARRLGELAVQVTGGDPAALRFCLSLATVAQVWDHVVDGDPVDLDQVHRAFEALVLDWPINPFVRANAASLVPCMAAAVNAWRCSTLPGCRIKAFDVLSEGWTAVAFILGGWDRVKEVMPEVRRTLSLQCEANDRKEETLCQQ